MCLLSLLFYFSLRTLTREKGSSSPSACKQIDPRACGKRENRESILTKEARVLRKRRRRESIWGRAHCGGENQRVRTELGATENGFDISLSLFGARPRPVMSRPGGRGGQADATLSTLSSFCSSFFGTWAKGTDNSESTNKVAILPPFSKIADWQLLWQRWLEKKVETKIYLSR